MSTQSGSGRAGGLKVASLLTVMVFVAGLNGGCSLTAASPSAGPTRTKFIPSPSATPEPTPTPSPTVRELPNLTGDSPTLDPDPPTCNVDVTIDFVVRNTGRGPTRAEALVFFTAAVSVPGKITLKTPMTLPILEPGASVHLTKTVRIDTPGPQTMTMQIDSSLWIEETDETDNQISRPFTVLRGSC